MYKFNFWMRGSDTIIQLAPFNIHVQLPDLTEAKF